MRKVLLALAFVATGCPGPDQPATPDAGAPDAGFTDVALDPSNTAGFQFETPLFPVAQGVEEQDCYFVEMPDLNNGQDLWVDHIRIGVNPGSHHANIFRVKTIVALGGQPGDVVKNGECFKSANWADWPLVANNQNSTFGTNYYDWHLPDNVAFRFAPHELLMVQTHYVNASTQETPYQGKVVVDMYKSALTAPIEMGTLFATQQSIRVCEHDVSPITYHGTCGFPSGTDIHVAAANGHFHSRGVDFTMFTWDGVTETHPPATDQFYESTTWDDPPMTVNLDKVINGGGVWWDCEYEWVRPTDEAGGCDAVNAADKSMQGDCCYTFGPKVETNEHCNAFVYYWPRVNRSDIVCQ